MTTSELPITNMLVEVFNNGYLVTVSRKQPKEKDTSGDSESVFSLLSGGYRERKEPERYVFANAEDMIVWMGATLTVNRSVRRTPDA